jgi:hypothetical protein
MDTKNGRGNDKIGPKVFARRRRENHGSLCGRWPRFAFKNLKEEHDI